MNQYVVEAAATSPVKASIKPDRSRATGWRVGLIAAAGLPASIVSSLGTRLFTTDPVPISHAVSTVDTEVLLRVIGTVLIDILQRLAEYL